MKKITKETLEAAGRFLFNVGRELEREIFIHTFEKQNEENILKALLKYQNKDGGFGNGMEPDFRLPDSSATATSIGLRILSEYIPAEMAETVLKKASAYLQKSFFESEKRWRAVPKTVNDYPHAPWWEFKGDIGMTVIDYSWGNPTAEIVAYLLEFKDYFEALNPKALNDIAIEKIEAKEEFKSEHEIYCYIPLYKKQTDEQKKKRLEEKITRAVQQLLVTDREKWGEYVPKPLDFVTENNQSTFGISDELINTHLDVLVDEMETNQHIEPTWTWGQYEEAWQKSKQDWAAILTLKALHLLKAFGRI